ncbi:four helix bundle protein [Aliikangiella marina]|uniref:Four helix bundle protein n=1 Tax=Aliikangiella marina TaxID=1712262 RepID=A0A545TIW9_9GAMM|nr:four helix bundle protein [Aliikangiella marina]TQV77170.1 four helix bundle protein [Aliikangiella marina]
MKFEDMDIWQRAVGLSTDIYRFSGTIKDFGFRDQITRAGLSIPSNIAESFERESIKECTQFLTYAKASGGELYTQIIIGKNVGFLDNDTAKAWLSETKAITAILGAIIKKRRQFN